MMLAHIIVAMRDSRTIARVQCKTCRGVHAFKRGTVEPRSASSGKKSSGKSASKATSAKTAAALVMPTLDPSKARRYRVTESFDNDAVIEHPSFGLGLVIAQLSDNKIEVLFPAGKKVLINRRAAS